MKIVVRFCFCFLIVVCSVFEFYKRFLLFSLGFSIMDCASSLKSLTQRSEFGCGFLVFGCFSQVLNLLGIFLMFCLGLMILQFRFYGRGLVQFLRDIRGRSSHIKDGLGVKIGIGEEFDAKIVSCKYGPPPKKFLESSKSKAVLEIDYDDQKECCCCCGEDLEFDVMALRRLLKIERQRASMACMELEKERMAAASAADETMAMILRLQNEKSAIEIEANQYRRLAEKKQEFDKEVIQSLQWIAMRLESERSLLEEKLMSFRLKLKQYLKDDDELDEFERVDARSMSMFINSTMEDDVDVDDEEMISSVDMDSSVLL